MYHYLKTIHRFTWTVLLTACLWRAGTAQELRVFGSEPVVHHEVAQTIVSNSDELVILSTKETGDATIELTSRTVDPRTGFSSDSVSLGMFPSGSRVIDAYATEDDALFLAVKMSRLTRICRFSPQHQLTHQHDLSHSVGNSSVSWWVPERGFMVATHKANHDTTGFSLHHFTPDGKKAWSRTYDEGGYARPHDVTTASDGGFLLCGTRRDSALLQRIDAEGNTLWSKVYGEASRETRYPLRYGAFHHFFETGDRLRIVGSYHRISPQLLIDLSPDFQITEDSLLTGSYSGDYYHSRLDKRSGVAVIHDEYQITVIDERAEETSAMPLRVVRNQRGVWLAPDAKSLVTLVALDHPNGDKDVRITCLSLPGRDVLWQKTFGKPSTSPNHFPLVMAIAPSGRQYEVYQSKSFVRGAPDSIWLRPVDGPEKPILLMSTLSRSQDFKGEVIVYPNGIITVFIPMERNSAQVTNYNFSGNLLDSDEFDYSSKGLNGQRMYAGQAGELLILSKLPRRKLNLQEMARNGETFADQFHTPVLIQRLTSGKGVTRTDTLPLIPGGMIKGVEVLPSGEIVLAVYSGLHKKNVVIRYDPKLKTSTIITLDKPPGVKRTSISALTTSKKGKFIHVLMYENEEDPNGSRLITMVDLNRKGRIVRRTIVATPEKFSFALNATTDHTGTVHITYSTGSFFFSLPTDDEAVYYTKVKKGKVLEPTVRITPPQGQSYYPTQIMATQKNNCLLYGQVKYKRTGYVRSFVQRVN